MKTFYSYFTTDNVYHIYKFSIYGTEKIKLVHAGLAYDNHGNYSKAFEKLKNKYNLETGRFESTSSSYRDFLSRMYMQSATCGIMANTVNYHPIILQLLKFWYDQSFKEVEKKAISLKEDLLNVAQPIPGKEKDFDTQMNILYSRFR